MKLFYNGTDIYNDVSLNYCVHEMYAEKQADTLVLRFNDTKGIWSKWNPADGDVLRFTEGASDTGKMFLHSMKPENGLFTIRAMAMPKSGATRKSKSWAGVRFLQLGNEIAANHGLTFQNYGCTDQVYPYLKQESETDFALFSRLCTLEGCQMLIFDGAGGGRKRKLYLPRQPERVLRILRSNRGQLLRHIHRAGRKEHGRAPGEMYRRGAAPGSGAPCLRRSRRTYEQQQRGGGPLRQGTAEERQ